MNTYNLQEVETALIKKGFKCTFQNENFTTYQLKKGGITLMATIEVEKEKIYINGENYIEWIKDKSNWAI